MNEEELMDVLTDIDEKYIEKAYIGQDALDEIENGKKSAVFPMKKKYIVLMVSVVVVLVASSAAFAYYQESKNKREHIVTEQSDERAIVTIPEGITKIRIVDGTYGDVITLDGESIEEFFEKINSVSGAVEYVGKGTGYQYAVHCYRGDERVLEFLFMTETIIKENVDERTDRVFTAEQVIPAFPYIQRMFEKGRAKN